MERWKPEIGDLYWIVDACYRKEVRPVKWVNDSIDNMTYKFGNCFRTQKKAEAAAEKVKELLLSLHEPVTECNQLPKLTAEVFDREDCPEWCKVGEWVWSPCDGGCYCRVSEIDGNRIFTKHRNESICFHIDKGDDFSSLRLCEARLRPWNFEEAPFAVKCRHSITAIKYQVAKLNSAGDGYTIADCCCDVTLQGMANYYEQMDGSPCGVLEHLENGEWVR